MSKEVLNEEVVLSGKPMVCETDLEGHILFVNRAFLSHMAYEREEIISQGFDFIRHPDVPDTMLAKMWAVLQQKEAWKGHVKLITKEGKYLWSEVYFSPQEDDKGQIKGYTAAFSPAIASMVEQAKESFAAAQENPDLVDQLV